MSAKRPPVDLLALTAEQARPMPEATQRMPAASDHAKARAARSTRASAPGSANLEALAFKVPPAFRKRFRERAVEADLKLNQLLFAALEAWEEKHGLGKNS